MPETPTDALNLVLFGMPAAGKSSLLGALAQAAQTQGHDLDDPSGGLEELRQRLYDGSPRPTVQEIAPYPIRLDRTDAVLIDCDGRAASDLLSRRAALDADGALARAVIAADALFLVVDASAPSAQLDSEFNEFNRFLRLLERLRGDRADIGGLPVFLVLTHCDLLAKPDDGASEWRARVELRTREVERRFRDFLRRGGDDDDSVPFGRVDLLPAATAVKRPALRDLPAKPREPWGVAELFRTGFVEAKRFRGRRKSSSQRLAWTVAGAAVVVAVLLSYATWVASHNRNTKPPSELQNIAERVKSGERPTPSGRLEGSREALAKRIAELADIRKDTRFDALPPDLRSWVDDRLTELREYDVYLGKLLEAKAPAAARSLAELDDLEQTFTKTLAVPRDEWSETRAARLRQERIGEIADLRKAVRQARDWFAQLRERGEALATFAGRKPESGASLDWRSWQSDVKRHLTSAEAAPFKPTDRVREPDGPTYRDTVLRFESAVEAKGDWERVRSRLSRILDLSGALGLGSVADRPPLLAFAEGAAPTPADLKTRLQELKKEYPRFEDEFRLANLPEAAVADVRQAAKSSYNHLLEPARAWVLRRLQAAAGDGEAADRWAEVRRWLQAAPEEFADWRVLARLLKRLHDPDNDTDPVSELASFLAKDQFDLQLRRLDLTVPVALGVAPQGDLVIVHESEGKTRALRLVPFGDVQRDPQGRTRTYSFRAEDDGTLVYRPGDVLYGRLAAKKADTAGEFQLTWARSRSSRYRFEVLTRGAFLHKAGAEATTGSFEADVRLTPGSDGRLPTVPDLLPMVPTQR